MLSYKQRSHWLWLRMTPCGYLRGAARRRACAVLHCVAFRCERIFIQRRVSMQHAARRRAAPAPV